MKTGLRIATAAELDILLPMVAAYHEFEQLDTTPAGREASVRKLLAQPQFGAVWLIQQESNNIGYIVLCRGYSIEFGGFDAFIDEFFIGEAFRGQGVGREVLTLVRGEARKLEINALHLEVARDNAPARRLYAACGFEPREKYLLMSTTVD